MPTEITDISQLNPDGVYSYADYLTWKFTEFAELIKGKLVQMAAPKTRHQRISGQFSRAFYSYLTNKSCEVFVAPFDVRLYDHKKSLKADKDIFTVIQPDLCLICDPTKIDERGCLGAPDFIIEILSDGNSKREMQTKYALYEEAGVLEYWIADPQHESIQQFVLNPKTDKYELHRMCVKPDFLTSSVFLDFTVDLEEIFKER
jgi:Uma2 family endonuclease